MADATVVRALVALKLGYPSYRPDDQTWAGMCALWSSRLAGFRPAVLEAAVRHAHQVHDQWFPTLGQFLAICSALQKTSLGLPVAPRSRRLEAPGASRERPGGLPPDSPYEELARRWEASPPTAGDAGAVAELVGRLAGGGQ